MSEILTESFCERCGARYTFETARPKVRLKGIKVLSRGLKNFVLSDDTTMDEAMAAARSEADREGTAHQLDAFHKTFSFCLSCRQYTCPNCWNETEARCQSCAPLAEPEITAAPFPSVMTLADATVVARPAGDGANGLYQDAFAPDETIAVDAEPSTREQAASHGATDLEAVPEAVPEAVTAEAIEDDVVAEPALKAASQTAGLLSRFRPGQNLDEELAAFERERSDAGTQAAEPVAAVAEEPEPIAAVAALEPEPVAAVAEEPEPIAAVAALEPEPVAAVAEEPIAAPTAADFVEQPTWRITAPDAEAPAIGEPALPDTTAPLHADGPSVPPVEPQWPTKPEWPERQASMGLPFLGRPAQPEGGVESLWAASNRELVATPPVPGRSPGIQPCVSCGLSLSATARFCRRCGTLQGG